MIPTPGGYLDPRTVPLKDTSFIPIPTFHHGAHVVRDDGHDRIQQRAVLDKRRCPVVWDANDDPVYVGVRCLYDANPRHEAHLGEDGYGRRFKWGPG